MSCGRIQNTNGVSQPNSNAGHDGTADHGGAHRPHAADDRRRRLLRHIRIAAEIAAPGIGDHQQPQAPIRNTEDAPHIAGQIVGRRHVELGILAGDLRVPVMREMKRGVEMQIEQ